MENLIPSPDLVFLRIHISVILLGLLRDVGAGLDDLYEAAVSHLYGGDEAVSEAEVPHFEDHARRFLHHTELRSIHWVNVTRKIVRFQTFKKE